MRQVGDRTVAYRTQFRLRRDRTWITTYVDLIYVERGRAFIAISFSRNSRPLRGEPAIAARLARRAAPG